MTKIAADWMRDPDTVRVMAALTARSGQAYFVGGCVRNTVLGEPVADIDIATSARPEETIALANAAGLRSIPTGIDHGTITVLAGGQSFEVTSFRRDVETDGRRAVVAFADTVAEDALRRDFTMNALYADANGDVLDPVGGWDDLIARRVRFIEDADHRIAEDYLRILRFFRFAAQYGDPQLGMDADGLDACARGAEGLGQLARERVGAEMTKLLAAADPAPALGAMAQTGVLSRVLPGADPRAIGPLVHLEQSLDIRPDWRRRVAALTAEPAVDALRLSRADAQTLEKLRAALADAGTPAIGGYRHGAQTAMDAALVMAASLGQPLTASVQADIDQGAAQEFPVKASDLMPKYTGPELGQRLRALEDRWIASGFALTAAELLD